jgi:cytochrome P450
VTAIAREVAAPPGAPPNLHRSDLFAPPASASAAGPASAHSSADFMSPSPSVRPGITVAAANWVYQRSEEYWPRALEFLPERWVPEDKGGAASVLGPTTPNAWSPFGGGPRQCVGIKFAVLEAVIALVRLFERFEFAPGPSQVVPMRMKQGLTLSPDGGVNVVVRRREAFFGEAARKEGAAAA